MISLILPVANHCLTFFATQRFVDQSDNIYSNFAVQNIAVKHCFKNFYSAQNSSPKPDPLLFFHLVNRKALGLFYKEITNREEIGPYLSTIDAARPEFYKNFYKNKPTDLKLLRAFNISMIAAQILLLVKVPVSNALRLLTLVTLVASSIFFARKRAFFISVWKHHLDRTFTFSHSFPITSCGTKIFSGFFFNTPQGTFQVALNEERKSCSGEFLPHEIEALTDTLCDAAMNQKPLEKLKRELLTKCPSMAEVSRSPIKTTTSTLGEIL